MANIDLENIAEPISDDAPCGPDLEFDMEFGNFTMVVDGVFPERYFSWDPGTLKGHGYYDQIGDLLERTRDLRLMTRLAKLRILEGDVQGFAETLEATHRLLKEHWMDCHPQPTEWPGANMDELNTLDENASVVLPFQHAVLAPSQRGAKITVRNWLLSQGDLNARDGEEAPDVGSMISAIAGLEEADAAAVRDRLVMIRDALDGLRMICMTEGDVTQAPSFDRLKPAVVTAIEMIETHSVLAGGESDGAADAGEGDAGAGDAGGDATGRVQTIRIPAGAIATREDAVEAMHVAARYFALNEPSSPLPVLLREAQNAASKSFFELLSDFVPDHAGSAFVAFGREPWFEVPLATLDGRNPAPEYVDEADTAAAAEDTGLGDETVDDGAPPQDGMADGMADGMGDGAGDSMGDGSAVPDQPMESAAAPHEDMAPVEGGGVAEVAAEPVPDPEPMPEPEPEPAQDPEPEPVPEPESDPEQDESAPAFVAASRPEAVELINKVLTYYRTFEPSSPVALILERALELSSKNFIELLGDVLPDGSLKVAPAS